MALPASLPASRIPPSREAPALRWGILGSGWIAERFIESARAHTEQAIVAVGSRGQERADEFASRMRLDKAYGDYRELVAADDLDVIYVATPHNLHHAHVMLARDIHEARPPQDKRSACARCAYTVDTRRRRRASGCASNHSSVVHSSIGSVSRTSSVRDSARNSGLRGQRLHRVARPVAGARALEQRAAKPTLDALQAAEHGRGIDPQALASKTAC